MVYTSIICILKLKETNYIICFKEKFDLRVLTLNVCLLYLVKTFRSTVSCFQGINPVLHMLFTFMQMYFLFMHARYTRQTTDYTNYRLQRLQTTDYTHYRLHTLQTTHTKDYTHYRQHSTSIQTTQTTHTLQTTDYTLYRLYTL